MRRQKTNSKKKRPQSRPQRRQLSAVLIQSLRTLAGQIGDIIPATSFRRGGFCFQAIARKIGLQKYWSPGTKKESIFGFLKSVYRDHPKLFYKLFRENIAQGIEAGTKWEIQYSREKLSRWIRRFGH
jgi:hypothetical protein